MSLVRNTVLIAALAVGAANLAATADLFVGAAHAALGEKRIYRVDSVIATLRQGVVVIQARGAVQSGGWKAARLRVTRDDPRTVVVEFVAAPPTPGAAVIAGLIPVTANARVRLRRRSVVAVRALAEANEMTTQILH